ncbi:MULTISPECIES: MFS transporter [Methylobacterium]|jgi:MFS family permease|uniref:MFS transporter n=1 Tax=Methylobacterium TaxID=407 RepID=UPI0008E12F64|nr:MULTISPECIES: MFS transporter [Methylobacterium]MBZ6411198.1 MFS transporter [Methylobacterium sp.]MBK3395673.1 MFS transporter [Methylobacterium ajmalii]MBK3407977.1 MFS transporter [Methylobacterium ajmalii]MBK3425984.1 MFS transporter [Methylobacterium ajmalii]SFE17654.1 Sugar transporter [Methylobacterium sp. yr596]
MAHDIVVRRDAARADRTGAGPDSPAIPDDRGRVRRVVVASSLGAVFEAYDLVLFGPMAAIIARQFFSGLDETYAYIFTLLSAAVTFLARPFGGVIFGRLGDLVGRKYTFLLTIVIMGGSTVAIGLLPTYAAIGMLSPLLLMSLRIVQGLAFGGEFGGAVTYIAEHASAERRGLATSAVGITMACGLVLAILVVIACETLLGKAAFEEWGWRIPFLLSAVLMLVSIYMRLRLQESPVFLRMRRGGGGSCEPLRETLGRWTSLRTVLLVLFGAAAGQSVASATGSYPIYLLMLNLKIDPFLLHYTILGYSTGLVACMVAAGWLSDRVGRKPVMLTGFIGTALLALPVYEGVTRYAHPDLAAAVAEHPITVAADPAGCHRPFDPFGIARFDSPCDIARRAVAKLGFPSTTRDLPAGEPVRITVGAASLPSFDGAGLDKAALDARVAELGKALAGAVAAAGYPTRADPARTNVPALIALLSLLNAFVALASAPLAAWMIELFPTRIRNTALSIPYTFGGWFGGFLPAIAFAAFTATGNLYAGLWYAVAILALASMVSALFLPETRGRALDTIA